LYWHVGSAAQLACDWFAYLIAHSTLHCRNCEFHVQMSDAASHVTCDVISEQFLRHSMSFLSHKQPLSAAHACSCVYFTRHVGTHVVVNEHTEFARHAAIVVVFVHVDTHVPVAVSNAHCTSLLHAVAWFG